MKEYVFGFKLAAALESNFKTAFSSASNQILQLNKKMQEHRSIAKACASAVKQGSLDIKSYNNALSKLNQSYTKVSDNAQRYAKIQGKINQRRTSMGQNEASAISLAGVAYGFAAPLKQAIKFESAMSDVRKVVDFDTPEQFKDMNKDILNLSKNIPMTAQGLAAIVAAGGQAGIARQDLLAFAESAAKMGTAFDITADEAGDMMAKWRTAFKMNQEDVVKLADKINYLSNKTAASAPLISDVVTRIGPLGEVGGVASGEIAALGASLVGSGIQSEIAATGIKNLILTMVAGESASKSQNEAFETLGFNAAEMAVRMQKDAKGAILDVLKALKGLDKAKQGAVLQNLFGKESIGAIAPLLSNLEGLEKNLSMVADAAQYAGSMQVEFDTKAATTANQLALMKNEFVAVETDIGNGMIPAFKSMLEIISPLAAALGNFASKNSELVGAAFVASGSVAALGAGFNALAWVGNGLALAYNGVNGAMIAAHTWMIKNEIATKLATMATKAWTITKSIGSAILKADTIQFMLSAARMGASAVATWASTAAQWAFNSALLACPIGWIIAGVAALTAAGYLLYTNWDTIKQFFVSLWDSPTARTLMFITGPVGWMIAAGTALIVNWDTVKQWFITLWDNPALALQQFVDGIKAKFTDAFTWVQEKWQAISDFISKPIFGKVNITAQVSGGNDVAHNALGGIYGKGAFLTTFAEDSGESAIPHTPNGRNIGLLAETNRIMGNPLGGGANITATFAPNITIQGGGDEGKIREVLELEMAKFKKMLQDLQNQQRRVSYA